jgi:TATA-box binding protein (TBP) (component of TFIID and TFIIIB)
MSSQFTVGGAVDLTKLVLYAPNAEIDKRRRPNVHIRVRNPHCSVQVNPSGFVSILGGKTRSELYLASRTVATMIKRSGAFPEARIQGFLINNIVLSCKTGRPLRRDLVEVQLQKLGIDAYSEQEIFPCVRVNLTYPKKHSCKVFRTGAFIVMGLTEIADSILSFKTFYDVIQKLPKTGAHEAVSYGRFQARDVPSGFDPDSEAAAAAGEAPRLNFDEYAAGANAEVKEEDDFTMEHIEM